MPSCLLPIVVLISGNGSNLQAIMDAKLPVSIKAVISDNPTAYGLERANQANITTEVVNYKDYETREKFDHALAKCIKRHQPKLIVLAGFMRLLAADLVADYPQKILNIHPSLLPKHPGLNTHQRVLDTKDTSHGVSIHWVTDELDAGPLITQAAFKVYENDTSETLKVRAQQLEHQMYPQVIQWLAQGSEFR